MNNSEIAGMVVVLAAVNVAAMFVLLVMSYLGSVLSLDGLELLDRWLDASQKPRSETSGSQKTSDQASSEPTH